VEPSRVHKDLYIDKNLFEYERENFFKKTWTYLAHLSQLPIVNDFLTLELFNVPLILIRTSESEVTVFINRCSHKGAPIVSEESGHLNRFFTCPYHAWTYSTKGQLITMPMKEGYESTGLLEQDISMNLQTIENVHIYRDFIFIRFSNDGPSFEEYFGEALESIDLLVERSPSSKLVVDGGIVRNVIRCNWKIYLENINDVVHPVSTHRSAVDATQKVISEKTNDLNEPKNPVHLNEADLPLAIEQILPFGNPYSFFDQMGGKPLKNGHSVLGVNFSIHSNYSIPGDYVDALKQAHGVSRTDKILNLAPQNSLLYPSIAIKTSPQCMRIIRPISVDQTLIESISFRVIGAPDLFFDRSMTYNRLVFSPFSIVAHDDVFLFESSQKNLTTHGNPWISLHRDFSGGESTQVVVNAGNEIMIRNQHQAWLKLICQGNFDAK
jgi:phenylpropionate dioxygenase-like ring-hydroxylating dioxygenase large terminal subunit